MDLVVKIMLPYATPSPVSTMVFVLLIVLPTNASATLLTVVLIVPMPPHLVLIVYQRVRLTTQICSLLHGFPMVFASILIPISKLPMILHKLVTI